MKFTDLLTPVIGLSLGALALDYFHNMSNAPSFISGAVTCALALWVNSMRFKGTNP